MFRRVSLENGEYFCVLRRRFGEHQKSSRVSLRPVSSACHLDSIFPADRNVVVQKNQHAGFLHELEVNASAEVLVYYEDSIGHLRSLVGVVEQLIFVIEQLSREFMAVSNLLDLSNQNFILLLNENEDWLFHFPFKNY